MKRMLVWLGAVTLVALGAIAIGVLLLRWFIQSYF